MKRWQERCRSVLLAVPLAVLLGALTAVPATARAELVDSLPADGEQVLAVLDQVSLSFTEPVLAAGATVEVVGPGGPASSGFAEVVGDTVNQPLSGPLPDGRYTVSWRVGAADGLAVSGRFIFELRASGEDPDPATLPTGGPALGPTTSVAGPIGRPTPTGPHTLEPGMEGMTGMEHLPAGTSAATAADSRWAIGGLVLVVVSVGIALWFERRRRLAAPVPTAPTAASGHPTD